MGKPKILVITPIKHISDVYNELSKYFEIIYIPEATKEEVINNSKDIEAIYTNPNKSNIFIGKDLIDNAKSLKVVCTASTGTNHIDKKYLREKNINLISLTEERKIINTISSTAEHAFALLLSTIRNIPMAWDSVKDGSWDYEPYIGRQLDKLVIGSIGYGRLGTFFCNYAKAFGSKVLVYDPYKEIHDTEINKVDLNELLMNCDVISFHVHVSNETEKMVSKEWFSKMKDDVLMINTSRGDIIVDEDLLKFLNDNPKARYSTDVLSNETEKKQQNLLLNAIKNGNHQLLVTPHIGGMTREGQEIAYSHAAKLLINYFC